MSTNWTTLVLNNGPKDPDSVIYIDAEQPDRKLTWKRFVSFFKSVAAGLTQIGFQPDDCVALVSTNDICYFALAEGVVAAGGVFAPLSPLITPDETAQQLQNVLAKWVFVEEQFLPSVIKSAVTIGLPRSNILIFDPAIPSANQDYRALSTLLQSDEMAFIEPKDSLTDPERPLIRMLTSGSTGRPKAAELSHKAVISRPGPFSRWKNHSAENKHLLVTPAHHASGHRRHTLAVLGVYILVVSKKTDATSIIDLISRLSKPLLWLWPRQIEEIVFLVRSGVRNADAFKSLRDFQYTGNTARPQSLQAFKAMLPPVASANIGGGYGGTDTGLLALAAKSLVPGYVGPLSPAMETIIVDRQTNEEVENGNEGEICCRGPSLFTGYVDNETATKAAFLPISTGRWYQTGDQGHINPETGYLAITGRFKEILKVWGDHVSPEEVEAEIMNHPGVFDVAVTSVPGRNNRGDLEPAAAVVRRDPSLTKQELVNHVAKRLSHWKAPTGGVVFVDEIPRNFSRKIVRTKVAQIMEADKTREFLDAKA